jgi:hypothetical protein
MTVKQAESRSGYQIETLSDSAGPYVVAMDGDRPVKMLRAPKGYPKALGELVEILYREECQRTFHKQGWRCARCAGLKPLQGHHKIKRSKGRVDRDNIEGLCAACHGKEHGG